MSELVLCVLSGGLALAMQNINYRALASTAENTEQNKCGSKRSNKCKGTAYQL